MMNVRRATFVPVMRRLGERAAGVPGRFGVLNADL